MNRLPVIILMLVLGLCLAPAAQARTMTKKDLVREAMAAVSHVQVERARQIWEQGGTYFIDCREDKEFRRGHIPGAINIPRGWLEFKVEELIPERDAQIIVYCRSGDRSSLGVQSLRRMGYSRALNLDGGWRAWNKAGFPVE